ncbi:MAG: tetratricopeptide repeat protein, partial [Bryobacteraceae bacterium]
MQRSSNVGGYNKSRMRYFVLAAAFAVLPLWAARQAPEISSGFDHFYNLEYDQALVDFHREIERQPNDPDGYNHAAQSILYRGMFRSGALESELVGGTNSFLRRPKVTIPASDEAEFFHSIDKAVQLSQALIQKDPNDKKALYALGVAYGLRANYDFLVRKAWRDSLRDASLARETHAKLTAIDPSFIDARLTQGLDDYVIGSLSWAVRMLGFLAGIRGDREEGVRELELVATEGEHNKINAQILLAVIYRREKRPSAAIPLLENLSRQFPRNPLYLFEIADMYSDAGDKQNALKALVRIQALKDTGAPGFKDWPEQKIRYARGNLLFRYDDLDPALVDLKQVAQ